MTGNGALFVADEGQLLSGGTVTYTHGAVWEYTVTSGFPGGTPTKVGRGSPLRMRWRWISRAISSSPITAAR